MTLTQRTKPTSSTIFSPGIQRESTQKRQNSLVDEYIRTSRLTQLSRALKIQKLATQCIVLDKIIKREKYCLDEPKEKIYEDLALLRFYLQQLISP
jgi:hypothetical protein